MLSEQPVLGKCGMIATAHYLATHAGLHILTHGGNAIDAAIAAAAAMTVVYPSTCSAGGDVFMLIWEAKTQCLYGLDGSGRFQSRPGGIGQELRGQAGIHEHLTNDVAEAVMMEEGFSAATSLALDLLGHRIGINGPWEDGIGHAQIAVINPDTHIFEGAADPRCDSLALGW